jgi:hypothetical protein
MIDRSFVDPDISYIFDRSCKTDRESAGCNYFEIEYQKGTEELNPYSNVPSIQMYIAIATTMTLLRPLPKPKRKDLFLKKAS